ncbi:hypothetical protein QAD02_020173 [Eretmocerus hayati]|uniref:Uncharacterized protein n=1 Tax=Eretmocerus hayati TaxID=131215 RepID=A0ACC2PLM2_9HYME|nr:hypothetical protein QAD02_020173 [Eretmocerus hayati]
MCHQVISVENDASPASPESKDEEQKDSVTAEDRISSSYGAPAEDYGPPPGSNYDSPRPQYGPPELTGDYRPTKVYEPPPAEQPPPSFNPPKSFSSYGPPSKPKPQYGPPKPTYGPPKPQYGPPKPQYGPPKPQYGPPKPQYGPPKPQYGPPKPQYGPPKPQYGPPKPQYGPPKPQYGPPKPQYGPPKPQYGPPKPQYGPPKPEYGPPKPEYGPPKPEYGPPKPEYGPPKPEYGPPKPPQPQYGPPTGGFSDAPAAHGPPIPLSIEQYGPPNKPVLPFISRPQDDYGPPPSAPQQEYSHPSSGGSFNSHLAPPPGVGAPPTPPDIKYDGWQPIAGHISAPNQQQSISNDYGPPISSNNNGASFPNDQPSGEYGAPLDGRNPTSGGGFSSDAAPSFPVVTNPNVPSDSYGVPLNNPDDHNLKSSVSQSTVSHENDGLPPPALPQFEPLHNNQPPIDTTSFNNVHQSSIGFPGSANADSLAIVKTVGYELLSNPGASGNQVSSGTFNGHSGIQLSDSYGAPSFGVPASPGRDDFSQQQLPSPAGKYGAPSFSSTGHFPPQGHRGGSSFNHFGLDSFKGHGNYRNRNRGSYKSPALSNAFIPPRRPPMKFRDSVPAGLVSNLNKYLPPPSPHKTFGPSSIQSQQLPHIGSSGSFHGASNSFSADSHSQSSAFNNNAALAAPNVNYGTPLTFNSFNTPSPALTYGAPNFVPPSSIGGSGNLYQGVDNSFSTTYGLPGANEVGRDCQGHGGSFQYNLDPTLTGYSNQHAADILAASPNFDNQQQSILNESPNAYLTPKVNELELQKTEESQGGLRDSYGNPIVNSYTAADQSNAAAVNHEQRALSQVAVEASNNFNSLQGDLSPQGAEAVSAEALTAALTAQGYHSNPTNIVPSNEVDATQFLKSYEGDQALALAQTLTGNGDGFQIQGSQGTYTLQIQPAGGGLGTANSDGDVRHEQVLSNGLLNNILAAIEQQTGNSQHRVQGEQKSIGFERSHSVDLNQAASSQDTSVQSSLSRGDTSNNGAEAADDQKSSASEESKVALYFNTKQESNASNDSERMVEKSDEEGKEKNGQS